MVERKPAHVNAGALSRAENLVARTDVGIDGQRLNDMRALTEMGTGALTHMIRSQPNNMRNQALNYLKNFTIGTISS